MAVYELPLRDDAMKEDVTAPTDTTFAQGIANWAWGLAALGLAIGLIYYKWL